MPFDPNNGERWGEHWLSMWTESITRCLSLRMHLIPLAHNSKHPLERTHWSLDKRLNLKRALDFIGTGCNIGVVAGPSRLVILDYDSEIPNSLTPAINLTLTVKTPRGHQFYTKEPFSPSAYKVLKKRFPKFDTPRAGMMYALIPYSSTCTRDHEGGCDCEKHDYRLRTFLSGADAPIPFKDFVKGVI